MSDRRAETLLRFFRGRDDLVAIGNDDGTFRPSPLPKPMEPDWLAKRHLAGVQCLGFYLQTPQSEVCCSCVDFDGSPTKPDPDPQWREKAVAVALFLLNLGVRPVVEVSASGEGAHVWLILDQPTAAWVVRAFWRVVEAKTGVKFKEIYPRQDYLSGKGVGNLVRYPLWNKSRFVEPEGWTELDIDALESVERVSAFDLRELAGKLGHAPLRPGDPPAVEANGHGGHTDEPAPAELSPRVKARISRAGSLLARRWDGEMEGMKDQSRSALVQAIATELVRQYVPTPEIEQAVRFWCAEHEYEKGGRPDWVRMLIGKAYDFVFSRVEERSASATLMVSACHKYLDSLERGEVLYLPSGIDELDQSVDGLAPGEMAIIAARPGQGKTAFGCQWLDNAAGHGTPCLLVSEEMSAVELGKRAITSFTVLHPKSWSPEAVPGLRREVDRHYGDAAPIYLVENCATIDRCEDVIDQHCSLHGVKLVAVDYLQLLGARGMKKYEQVTDISRRLKQCARRNNVRLLALCQLNREIEGRPNHEPKLSDLRDSGNLEQDGDLVIFLQWPVRFNPLADPDEYWIVVGKRRNGPIRQAKIVTKFNPERQRIGWFPGTVANGLPR